MYHLIGLFLCIFKKFNLKLFFTDYTNALYVFIGLCPDLESNVFFFILIYA